MRLLRSRAFRRAAPLAALLALPLGATLDHNRDGVSDVWSALYPTAIPPSADTDGDGATNQSEALAGTDPLVASSHFAAVPTTNADGAVVIRWSGIVGKRYQIESSSDLRNWTTLPGDYLGAGSELSAIVRPAGISPVRMELWRIAVTEIDADSDGLNNWEEAQLGTSNTSADTDHDGMPDAWEARYGLDPTVDDAGGNPDRDDFTNGEEFAAGMSPQSPPATTASLLRLELHSVR